MEKHIFKFGGNSAALIIPKKWLDKSGLKSSDTVYITESESGNLIISPKETVKKESEKVVTSKTKPLFLSRWVGLHYMYGTGKLRVYSADGLTQAQMEGIEDRINAECPGFEITSQSNKDMIIEDFTDIKEIDLERIISRLRSLINQEFAEMKQSDPKTIARLEKLVNRSYMMGVRYVNITQAKDALVYLGVLEFLEAISDKLDAVSSSFKIQDTRVFDELDSEFELCFPALKGDSKALEKVAEVRESVIKRLSHSRLDKVYAKLLVEVADNISSIAEFGLRVENSSPLFVS